MSIELELALAGLAEHLEAPSGEGLVEAVLVRLAPPRRSRARWLLVALAILAVGAATAVASSGALRDQIRTWFATSRVEVTIAAVPPSPSSSELGLGSASNATAAARLLGVPPPSLVGVGRPHGIFVAGSIVTLVWRATASLPAAAAVPSVGALLSMYRVAPDAFDESRMIQKSAGAGVDIEYVELEGSSEGAVWIEGAPHTIRLFDGTDATYRLAANVLYWRRDDVVYRLESALPRPAALSVAGLPARNP